MCSLINKQLLLTAYAYLFITEQQKAQQGSKALKVEMNAPPAATSKMIFENEKHIELLEKEIEQRQQRKIVDNAISDIVIIDKLWFEREIGWAAKDNEKERLARKNAYETLTNEQKNFLADWNAKVPKVRALFEKNFPTPSSGGNWNAQAEKAVHGIPMFLHKSDKNTSMLQRMQGMENADREKYMNEWVKCMVTANDPKPFLEILGRMERYGCWEPAASCGKK